jgi:flagellar capping protein FliD
LAFGVASVGRVATSGGLSPMGGFLTTGFVARMYSGLTTLMRDDTIQQNNLGKTNLGLDEQIARLKAKLEQQRETLTNAFIKMLEAQSLAESQNKTLLDAFSTKRDN